jgi:5'-3' exonuclease
MISTIILDASCLAFIIESKLESFNAADPDAREGMIVWLNERLWLNSATPCRTIWALDSKPYWRSRYEPEYKANRPAPTLNINPTMAIIRELPNAVAIDEFEADDIAGAYVRELEGDIHLLTVDSDWQGLVSKTVTMFSPIHEPHVRCPLEAWAWLNSKAKKISRRYYPPYKVPNPIGFDPREIWRFKARFGDAGDNLPPGSALGLLDLLDPLERPDSLPDVSLFPALPYNYDRANAFMRALPDTPFPPIRFGAEYV